MAGIIQRLGSDRTGQEALYRAYRQLFGFPGPEDFQSFSTKGLHPDFVTLETEYAKQLVAGRCSVATGLQLWQVGEAGIRESLAHAWKAQPDGIIFHCHGWATLAELEVAGDWIRARKSARPQ